MRRGPQRGWWTALAALLLGFTLTAQAQPAPADTLLDDFRDAAAWQAGASDQVQASAMRGPQGGICLRYDFGGVSGYAVLRRALPLELPPHYELRLRLRGQAPANAFQFKLVDASGDSVWWMNRPAYAPPAQAEWLRIRQRQIEFAWGPAVDRTLRRAAAIELVVASGPGGRGEICFEQLRLRTLPPPMPLAEPRIEARSTGPHGSAQWQIDYGAPREINGLMLRWAGAPAARDIDVQFSDDGRIWRTVQRLQGSRRRELPLWLPDSETRYLRLVLRRGPGADRALAAVQTYGPTEWPRFDAVLQALAAAAPRGRYPRAYLGEQNYWTIVGTDGGGAHAALISEDGAIEPGRGGPSLEPFVVDETGAAASWADVAIEHRLRDGYLPLPQVEWQGAGYTLAIEAGAEGTRSSSRLLARYTMTNTSNRPRTLTLLLALRPWQVNPPQQFLNTPGGAVPVQRLAWRAGGLAVDGRPWLRAPLPPERVGLARFEQGDALALALDGAAPHAPSAIDDGLQHASAVLRWPVTLAPGASRSIPIVFALAGDGATDVPATDDADADVATRLDALASAWRARLNRVSVQLPANAPPLADTLRSALAQILMSRDGPALQPGTRSYARSWIRDGAMMVAGLLRLGEIDAAREFVDWYAGHLFANGKVPCCVDGRGADPVAENDSHGEFIFAVAELWRHTGDRALVERLWPQVDAAARYMEALRQSERGTANREPGREAFFGLMPASISHEGYSAKPMHSYWDDYWALTGYRDAARLAEVLGLSERTAELHAQAAEFRQELGASLAAAVAQHRIDYLPGAAELGDFDPSSSTLIFSPAGAEALVPPALLHSTWQRYWRESVERRDGRRDWQDYTPYELRSVSALLRLGEADEARAMLDFFLADRRPARWNQWAEVIGRAPRAPRFIGDMPHAWVSSDYIRSVLDLFAYTRDSDDALVLGAGVPEAWWRAGPVAVSGLGTAWGRLGYRMAVERAPDGDALRLQVDAGLAPPPGGLWFAWQGRLLRLPAGAADLRLPLGERTTPATPTEPGPLPPPATASAARTSP